MDHSNAILLCLVHGDPFDRVFEVEIEESRHVRHLKRLIQAEIGDEFLAKDLTLWGVNILIGDMATLEKLRLEEDQNDVRKLFPGHTIQEVLPNRPYSHVHVLVVLPEKRGVKRKVDDRYIEMLERVLERLDEITEKGMLERPDKITEKGMLERLDKITEKVDSLKEDTKVSISISQVNQTQYQELLAEHHLQRRTIELDVPPCERQVQEFVWNQAKEDAHASAYLKWLIDNISLPSSLGFYLASTKPNLLSTGLASSRYRLNGTLDSMIVEKAYVKDLNTVAGVRVGIEKKKVVAEKDSIQAVVQLIAADIYSNFPVVVLLTDLRGHWQFFWFQIGHIVSCTLDLRRGITLLEAIVGVGRSAVSAGTPIGGPILTRCTFLEAVLQEEKRGEVVRDVSKTMELEMLLNRPKVNLLQMLLPDDVIADMRDVYDVMSPAEIRKWEMEKALELAVKSPAIQSMLGSSGWKDMYV